MSQPLHFPDRPADLEEDFERDLHTEHQVLNMGPSHPATHGTVKFLIELDGENIVNLDIQVGYLHRGFEKECESGTWYQAIPYTDRLNYNSAILANLGYCMAVEKLVDLDVPPRAQALRVILTELQRLASHLVWIGTHALDLAAMSMFMYAFREREIAKIRDQVGDGKVICGLSGGVDSSVVAVLLHEARRADYVEGDDENAPAEQALTELFGLERAQAAALLEEARTKAQQVNSFYAPLSVVKRDFSLEERIRLVEHLWRVAYADGQLNYYEDHYVRKIAHLLHIPNTQSMLARNRASMHCVLDTKSRRAILRT